MANPEKLHIAMFPWLAFGHTRPFLQVAKLIAEKGHSISFISTPKNIKRLPKIPPNLVNHITLVEFSLPSIPGLPEGAEATSDMSYNQVPYLKVAYDQLQDQLAQFLELSSPDWLILDYVPYWAPPLASRLGISTAFFGVFIASALAFVGPPGPLIGEGPESDTRKRIEDWTVKPRWVPFESNVAFRYFEIRKLLEEVTDPNLSVVPEYYRFGMVLKSCNVIALRSTYEFESRELKLLENIDQKPIIPVGQLPPDASIDSEDSTCTWQSIKDWLNKQARRSVIYVAFGSEATFSQQELAELALGLEMSGFPFFWVLKSQKEELPDGFLERTREQAVVWTSWAPQLRILSHESVAGMLSHSGWSSVVEVITQQKPLILFTMYADQGLNAKVLEREKMGYVIPRHEKDGSFTRKSVADSLRLVVEKEEGRVYREKVKEMSGLFGDRERQSLYTEKLVGYLKSRSKKASK